jgi:hypothetical protein
MVRPNYQQRVENVRYYARCVNNCGNTIRNKKHPNTAFYWKEMGLCRIVSYKQIEVRSIDGKR